MRGKYKNFTGCRFGKITVTREEKEGEKWYCFGVCDCGNTVKIRKDSLSSGKTKSCGCDKRSETKIEQLKIGRNLKDHTSLCFFENDAPSKNNTSGLKGVSYVKRTKKYRAFVGYKNKTYSLGEFETIEEAQTVREKAVKMVKSGNFERWIGRKNE